MMQDYLLTVRYRSGEPGHPADDADESGRGDDGTAAGPG